MQGFASIVGHTTIIDHLQQAIRLKKVSHAYIFSGESGMGKRTLADAFAASLQCEKEGIDACGHCKSCLQAASKNHPDIHFITHEKASLGVDDIRLQLNNDIYIKPYSSKYKVYIIPDAEKMTEAAQNALLKTLEEPPAYAVILLLTTNIEAFLSTILSRCIALKLKPLEKTEIKQYLMEKSSLPDYQASISAEFSFGNLGRAIQYATGEQFQETKEAFLHLMKYLDEMDTPEIIHSIRIFTDNKDLIDDFFELLLLWFRDVLLYKAAKDVNSLLFARELTELTHYASLRSFEQIENILTAIDKAKFRLAANANPEIVIELLVLTIKDT